MDALESRPRSRIAPAPIQVQQGLAPGRPAGVYIQEPDQHAPGEAEWPGRQPPTRQLTLFDSASFAKESVENSPPPSRAADEAPAAPARPVQLANVERERKRKAPPADDADERGGGGAAADDGEDARARSGPPRAAADEEAAPPRAPADVTLLG